MGFSQAVKSFWSRYTNFKGRSRRSEYWYIQLFLIITNLAAAAIDLALMDGDVDRFIANGGGGIVGLVWILVTILPALAVLVRRLHDTGKSGWWALIGLIPLAGGVVLFVFSVLDSTAEENQYGAPVK
ncbi:MAG: DUF805 domain-containing protein [Candidatus Aquiluna sp.]|nr:DUF805 domain-containing protein [Aquiluna sp.]